MFQHLIQACDFIEHFIQHHTQFPLILPQELGHLFGLELHHRQRHPDFMGCIRSEPLTLLEGLFQTFKHLIEQGRELPQLEGPSRVIQPLIKRVEINRGSSFLDACQRSQCDGANAIPQQNPDCDDDHKSKSRKLMNLTHGS